MAGPGSADLRLENFENRCYRVPEGFAGMNESVVMQLPVPTPSGQPARGVEASPRPLAVRVGYDMRFDVPGPAPTAMVLMLFAHPEVAGRLESPERLTIEPDELRMETFLDPFGNRCARVIVPPGGTLRVAYENVFQTTCDPEPQPDASTPQAEAGLLPADVLPFLYTRLTPEVRRANKDARNHQFIRQRLEVFIGKIKDSIDVIARLHEFLRTAFGSGNFHRETPMMIMRKNLKGGSDVLQIADALDSLGALFPARQCRQ